MILTPAEIAKYQRVTDSKCADCGLGCHDEGCIWTWITVLLADREELEGQIGVEVEVCRQWRASAELLAHETASLRTRAEQAEAERDHDPWSKADHHNWQFCQHPVCKMVRNYEAEITRLREALEQMDVCTRKPFPQWCVATADGCRSHVARAALNREGE